MIQNQFYLSENAIKLACWGAGMWNIIFKRVGVVVTFVRHYDSAFSTHKTYEIKTQICRQKCAKTRVQQSGS